jgi:cytochrome c peroxidase
MFPVTSRDEMRGSLADAANGNELAAFGDKPADFPEIWDAIMLRLKKHGYAKLFAAAYGKPINQLGFEHAAKAIAAFEAQAFNYADSPFDEYLRGNSSALSIKAKRGAVLFFGKANCIQCHSGTLLTDQDHYNLAVPQLGPGKDPFPGFDVGRFTESLRPQDRYRFRTPPLRNVTETGPWMHNGAFNSLEDAVRHHLNPVRSLMNYDPDTQLDQEELRETVVTDRAVIREMVAGLGIQRVTLNRKEMQDLLAFLESLTVPNLNERLLLTIPDSVPSGLLEDGIPDQPR